MRKRVGEIGKRGVGDHRPLLFFEHILVRQPRRVDLASDRALCVSGVGEIVRGVGTG